jgi:hypothetical protein
MEEKLMGTEPRMRSPWLVQVPVNDEQERANSKGNHRPANRLSVLQPVSVEAE